MKCGLQDDNCISPKLLKYRLFPTFLTIYQSINQSIDQSLCIFYDFIHLCKELSF